ncbi:PaaI family thioesterase [Porphyromonas levii]|uniref:PaaI family thioesterase n=1 Tax=Porphyromonas levii TaxID=28114 RepID=A0A4Y8WRC0_9PORP|nr:PaaI family thioesterase [Porphyromonas levii]TFH95081.1 PaaI family thioesterase [Porphyromonas levii]TFH95312.1 PaaI family thioesterase [Porphyromonas levii]
MKAFQDYYSEEFSHCYGCGSANEHGLKIKSYWYDDDSTSDTTIAHFLPQEHFTGGFPKNVYGGLIAAILDCHGNGTAAAAGYRHFGRAMDTLPNLRYVTANLNINFLSPTPMGQLLELRAVIKEVTDRKVVMELELWAADKLRVSGSMVSVLLNQGK